MIKTWTFLLACVLAASGCATRPFYTVDEKTGFISGPHIPKRGEYMSASGRVVTPSRAEIEFCHWLDETWVDRLDLRHASLREAVDEFVAAARRAEPPRDIRVTIDMSHYAELYSGLPRTTKEPAVLPTLTSDIGHNSFRGVAHWLAALSGSHLRFEADAIVFLPYPPDANVLTEKQRDKIAREPPLAAAERTRILKNWNLPPSQENEAARLEARRLIEVGMTREDVKALLGAPFADLALLNASEQWNEKNGIFWPYDLWHADDHGKYFVVAFDESGKVMSVSHLRSWVLWH